MPDNDGDEGHGDAEGPIDTVIERMENASGEAEAIIQSFLAAYRGESGLLERLRYLLDGNADAFWMAWDAVATEALDNLDDADDTYDYVEATVIQQFGMSPSEGAAIGAAIDLLEAEGEMPDSTEMRQVLSEIVEAWDTTYGTEDDLAVEPDAGRRWRLFKGVSKLSGGLVVVSGDIAIVMYTGLLAEALDWIDGIETLTDQALSQAGIEIPIEIPLAPRRSVWHGAKLAYRGARELHAELLG